MTDHLAPRFLLFGHDTIECSYYAKAQPGHSLDFDQLGALRESLRLDKQREPKEVNLAGESFLLQPYGASTGYPFVLCCQRATISCGPQNVPMFHVKWNSGALWREGISSLHGWFLDWLQCAGFDIERPETLSRVDSTFDYYLPVVDFDSDSFVSLSTKDAQYRADRVVQTFDFGRGDVKLRVYDKVAEISDATPAGVLFDPGKQRQGKPIKPILIEWTEELRQVWKEAAGTRVGAVALFPTSKGTHYSRGSFQSIWQRWRKKIPISDLRWHDIRRKTGSDSATDAEASERLNHADEAITKAHYRAKPKRVKPLR